MDIKNPSDCEMNMSNVIHKINAISSSTENLDSLEQIHELIDDSCDSFIQDKVIEMKNQLMSIFSPRVHHILTSEPLGILDSEFLQLEIQCSDAFKSLTDSSVNEILSVNESSTTECYRKCSQVISEAPFIFQNASYFPGEHLRHKKLSESLHPTNSSSVRLTALKKLDELVSNEMLINESCIFHYMKNLRFSLGDNDEETLKLCLQVHGKIICSDQISVVKLGFQNIYFYLRHKLCSRYQIKPLKSLSITDNEQKSLLLVFRLLLDGLKICSYKWFRNRTLCSTEILSKFFHLLNINFWTSNNLKNVLNPLNLLTALDPHASWLKLLCKSVAGRNLFIEVFSKHKDLFLKMYLRILKSINSNSKVDDDDDESSSNSSNNLNQLGLQHLALIHCLSVYEEVLKWRNLTAVIFEYLQVYGHSMHQVSLNLLDNFPRSCRCRNLKTEFCPSTLICKMIGRFFAFEFENLKNVDLISRTVNYIMLHASVTNFNLRTIHNVNLCKEILDTAETYAELDLENLYSVNGLVSICKYFSVNLNSILVQLPLATLDNDGSSILKSIVSVCERYLSNPDFVKYLFESEIYSKILQIQKQTIFTSLSLELRTETTNLLYAMFKTQNGIFTLIESNYFKESFEYVLDANFSLNLKCYSLLISNQETYLELLSSAFFCQFVRNLTEIEYSIFDDHLLNYAIPSPFIYFELESKNKKGQLNLIKELRKNVLANGNESYNRLYLIVLNLMISSLHTLLLIQREFNLVEELTESQYKYSNAIIKDDISWRRNHILVQTLTVGGPNERKLPNLNVEKEADVHSWEFVTSRHVPSMYWIYKKPLEKVHDLDVHDLIAEPGKILNISSLIGSEKLHKLFHDAVLLNIEDKLEINDSLCSEISQDSSCFYDEGLSMIIRYGMKLGLLQKEIESSQNLKIVLNHFARNSMQNEFDFFASIIYLLFGGHVSSTIDFLEKFKLTNQAKYLWFPWINHGRYDNHSSKICQVVEYILFKELQEVYSAFKLSNYSPIHIVQIWMRQIFINYLNISEICQVILFILLNDGYHVIYIILALFNHLKPCILVNHHRRRLTSFLLTQAINSFSVTDSLNFIKSIQQKYGHIIDQKFNLNKLFQSSQLHYYAP